MSLYGVMRTGVSGMNAQSNKLSTVSDNIANVNTTGYKRASTEFSSLILKSGSGNYDSGAVETTVRYAISDAGNYQFTTSATDLAVQGNGFFVVQDPNGTNFLTRAGAFVPDSTGNLVNAAGFQLMGYNIANGATPTVAANGFGGLQVVNVNQMALQASASTKATVAANLDPSATFSAGPAGPANYTSKTSIVTYDNIGNAVTLDVYAKKTAANTWDMQVYNGATALPSSGPSTTFTFDVSSTGKGKLDLVGPPPSATSLTVAIPGGSAAFNIDLSATTQVASSFDFKATVDGNAPSAVDKVNIDDKGVVTAVLKNGTTLPSFQIALATVPSPDHLTPEVGNVYSPNLESGNVQVGLAGQGGLGTIQSGALEDSNVDLADELTSMIEAQRGFTANSKSFQTGADLLDVVVNLKR
ncbi:flagellar hook protein FlgE [Bradyrhizobium canariense]|uniref:Flagellar hook protein FlgE n=1 Tax=Bradyrhizobium canariense TaxID=255045 RepID=A0ABX3WV00_9BRAD|nr:flagellar hook protein FlgE [Bradyrhizobium canariense]OSI21850.1 flagellar hook protein FlgE [Bradyrhizobium canariense]OSI29387.1 flagellar hook protein FlgE [Bradyrhizobium canariense]OSI38776.1 flagellar hook protein FlgE [Bradyrhizobium canariense]OSI45439.1 flagellar hook protein FlgE [Bradyrhizobium canariense]OSI56607.1 flagellar hook protein FlgE [Bradyrhizobium canariense]